MKATIAVKFLPKEKEYFFNVSDTEYLKVGNLIHLTDSHGTAVITQILSDLYEFVSYPEGNFSLPILHKGAIAIPLYTKRFKIVQADWTLDQVTHKPFNLSHAAAMYVTGRKDLATKIYPEPVIMDYLRSEGEAESKAPKEATTKEKLTFYTLKKLAKIAAGFNQGWKKESGNTGYFLLFNPYKGLWEVGSHTRVSSPGIIYFKNPGDVEKVILALTPQERDALRGV